MDVSAINLHERLALLDNGQTAPIVTLLDDDGDETDETAEAVVAVAGSDLHGWWSILLSDYETAMEN